MSIQSFVNNAWNSAGDFLSGLGNTISSKLENIVGSVSTKLSSIWSGGFTGISAEGVEEIKRALKTYCDGIEAEIATFNELAATETAYKGEIQVAAQEFIKATKEILQAYVSNMKVSIADADTAFQNYQAADKSVAQNVQADAQAVRQEAQSIRLD